MCGTCDTEFTSLAVQCQICTKCYHPTCAKMPLHYMVKYARSIIKFICKQCTEQLVEPHWTDTSQLFRDFFNNSISIENPHDLNDTDLPTEESRIESQTVNTESQVPFVLQSICSLLCLPPSSVSLSCFNLAVPMRKVSGVHSYTHTLVHTCMSSAYTLYFVLAGECY